MIDRRSERNFTDLVVGGWYLRQDGTIEEIVQYEPDDDYPFKGPSGNDYISSGDFFHNGEADGNNLIRRVKIINYDSDETPAETLALAPNFADKLASEMTVRELMIVTFAGAHRSTNHPLLKSEMVAERAISDTKAVIKAMEAGES